MIRDALRRAAADTGTVRAAWSDGGAIAKPMKLTAEKTAQHLFHLDRMIAAQEHLATEFDDPNLIITIAHKTTP